MSLRFIPETEIAINGIIKLYIPSEIAIGSVANTKCKVSATLDTYVDSTACTGGSNEVSITVP